MPDNDTVLSIRDLVLKPGGEAISEVLREREVVGLSGLDGHGQAAFLESLAGVNESVSGRVDAFTGKRPAPITSLASAARAHIGYLPVDRRTNGVFPNLSVEDNFTLGNLKRFSCGGWVRKPNARRVLASFREELSIVHADRRDPITHLSGGNQQKVLLARLMARNPKVMLLNDPTRGVDIATRQILYGCIRRAVRDQGMTFVILSTELEEIVELCDRVIVFREYAVSARLTRSETTVDTLMAAMFGQKREVLS